MVKLVNYSDAKKNLFFPPPSTSKQMISSPAIVRPAASIPMPQGENAEEDENEVFEEASGSNLESGEGLHMMKLMKPSDKIKNSFSYWDDPNELVDRLCLLHASRQAGNTNVSNEILSIESELRQASYIR